MTQGEKKRIAYPERREKRVKKERTWSKKREEGQEREKRVKKALTAKGFQCQIDIPLLLGTSTIGFHKILEYVCDV